MNCAPGAVDRTHVKVSAARACSFDDACRRVVTHLRMTLGTTIAVVAADPEGTRVLHVADAGTGLGIGHRFDAIQPAGGSLHDATAWTLRLGEATTTIRSTISVQLGHDPGETASLVLLATEPLRDPATMIELVSAQADVLTSVRDLERRLADAEHRALTDVLTELPNRRAWIDALDREDARAARHGGDVAIVVVDLNGLKHLNDAEGHAAGDARLRRAASALLDSHRASDLVARLGGDEFGLLLPHVAHDDLQYLVESIRERLAARGIGAATGGAVRSLHGDLLGTWHAADMAMYAAKDTDRLQPVE